ncbi:uncharacterized protein [Mobula birostris]|uniref:uncharacterized protein n=1 Tax=Mobula birostris TaxID=1983395 RepID=UPI003B282D7B
MVQCYGRGSVHEEIVKQLNINKCERPRIPSVLFVYNVSHETEDFQNALQWVTGGGRVLKEDICAVILLQKSRDVREEQISTHPGLFHEGTAVHRVLWRETSGILIRRKVQCHCPNTIRAIRQSLSDRTRSREHSSPVSSEDPQGSETPSLYSEQPDHQTSSTCTQEKSEKSSEKLQCNVQCYGRGSVHEEIVKKLNINQCERPRIPCVLFVYNVSHEIEDFRNALQWVTGGGRARKEDTCAVILLQKSQDVGEEKLRTCPGLFHEGTAVHRVLWRETSDILKRKKVQCHCPNTIRAIRQSLSDRTRSREHSSPEFSEDGCFHSPTMDKRNLETLRNNLCNYKPPEGCGNSCINILLVGLVGAGKSSTINTFLSALDPEGTTITCVPTGMNPRSLTKELRSYRAGGLKFWDSSGWNALANIDRTKRVLQMILEGRVPKGTNFQP